MNEFIVIAINRDAIKPEVLSSFHELDEAIVYAENLEYEKANDGLLIAQVKVRYKLSRVKHLS